MELLIKIILNAAALFAAAYLMKGVTIKDFTRAVIIAVILSLLNATIGNFLDFITTPLRWITLGIFSFVVDAAVLLIAAHFMKGFEVKGFGTAFVLAIVLSIFNAVLHGLYPFSL